MGSSKRTPEIWLRSYISMKTTAKDSFLLACLPIYTSQSALITGEVEFFWYWRYPTSHTKIKVYEVFNTE